jgi:hypothetical protein
MKEKRLRLVFLAVALICFIQLPVLISSSLAETETVSLDKGSVTLDAPYEIQETMMYRDGGTIGIVVKDAKGISLPLCYDQRIKVPEEQRFVYVGATHPSESSATKVIRGSATEQALLRILTSAKIVNPSPHIRQDLVQADIAKLRRSSKNFFIE